MSDSQLVVVQVLRSEQPQRGLSGEQSGSRPGPPSGPDSPSQADQTMFSGHRRGGVLALFQSGQGLLGNCCDRNKPLKNHSPKLLVLSDKRLAHFVLNPTGKGAARWVRIDKMSRGEVQNE